MFACFVTALLAGLVTVRTGCCVSRITVRTESVECPAASVATMCRVFWPSAASRALRLNAFPVMLATWPFTATLVAVWSCTLPATVTSVSRVIRPGDGLVIVIAGDRHRHERPRRPLHRHQQRVRGQRLDDARERGARGEIGPLEQQLAVQGQRT